MIRPVRPAIVSYYADADILGLGKILAGIRTDVTYPGDPGGKVKGRRHRLPCPITETATADDIWITETARQGWLAITRDSAIQDNRREIEAVRDSGARMVAIAGAEGIDTFRQLEVLLTNWRKIEALLDQRGPFIYTVTRTGGLTRVPLDRPPRRPQARRERSAGTVASTRKPPAAQQLQFPPQRPDTTDTA